MDNILNTFKQAYAQEDGYLLASTLQPHPQHAHTILLLTPSEHSATQAIRQALRSSNSPVLTQPAESEVWQEIYLSLWRVTRELAAAQDALSRRDAAAARWDQVYEAWKELATALHRGYTSAGLEAWTVPCLYVAGKWLRVFAIKADATSEDRKEANTRRGYQDMEEVAPAGSLYGGSSNDTLEDAARNINRIFSLCISDRAPLEDSRKWALYNISNMMFKTYFKLNSISLSKNILRSLSAGSTDLPPLSQFPKAHVATFKYYTGVIAFLSDDYAAAKLALSEALALLPNPRSSSYSPVVQRNRALILTYLIPTHLVLERKVPSAALLNSISAARRDLFVALARAIRMGDLRGFDDALEAGREEFVKRRVYLTLERARELCLRNLLRKVFLAAGWEEGKEGQVRKTRIKTEDFLAGVRLSMKGALTGDGSAEKELSAEAKETIDALDKDEVECLISGLVYKGLMKGYISRERSTVVLSKGGAFPGTGI